LNEDNDVSKNQSDKNKNNKGNRIIIWPLVAGVITIGFSILLLTLRVIAPSFIIALVGIFLLIYWIYLTKKRDTMANSQRYEQLCSCAICDHPQLGTCIKLKCMCCLIAKGNKIVGHTNNSLQ
jgi:hypothetical protein